jgi:hypothetical protein
VRLKTLAASGIFWILFFVVEEEYLVRKDSRQKTSRRMARRVLLILDLALTGNGFTPLDAYTLT